MSDQPANTNGRQMRVGPELPDGSVLIGYGDYGINTGPIDVISIDANGGVTTHVDSMDTEQIITMRQFGTRYLIPAIDPRTNVDAQLVEFDGSAWSTKIVHVDGENPLHLFDAVLIDDTYVVSGSKDGDPSTGTAMVWESNDGVSWTEVFVGGSGRFHDLVRVNNGDLAVQLNYDGPYYTRSSGWTEALVSLDSKPSPSVSVTLDNHLVHSEQGDLLDAYLPVAGPNSVWTTTLATNGFIWLSDGYAVYRLPPP